MSHVVLVVILNYYFKLYSVLLRLAMDGTTAYTEVWVKSLLTP